MKTIVNSDKAPAPIGPYSQGVAANGSLLFVSGQIGLISGSMQEGIEAQTRAVLENLGHVLREAGSDYAHVVKTTVFLSSFDDYAMVNSIYEEYFSESKPARAAMEVSRLPKDALVEIECVALIP